MFNRELLGDLAPLSLWELGSTELFRLHGSVSLCSVCLWSRFPDACAALCALQQAVTFAQLCSPTAPWYPFDITDAMPHSALRIDTPAEALLVE